MGGAAVGDKPGRDFGGTERGWKGTGKVGDGQAGRQGQGQRPPVWKEEEGERGLCVCVGGGAGGEKEGEVRGTVEVCVRGSGR